MRTIDLPLIRLSERFLQWTWDVAGISRIMLLRGLGTGAAVFAVTDAIRTNGSLQATDMVLPVMILFAQGAAELMRNRAGRTVNLHIDAMRQMPMSMLLRLTLLVLAAWSLVDVFLIQGQGPNGYRWFLVLRYACDALFFYVYASCEPTEPPKYQERQARMARGAA